MQLLLIRHARNDWVDGRLAGRTPGVHLNEEGRAEAAALAARLAETRLDAIYASPLERAQETARFVAGPHELDVRPLPALGEIEFADWTGQHLKTLREDESTRWHGVQHHPSGTRFPGEGGETLYEAQARAVAGIEGLKATHAAHEVVAVVSHADVIKAVVAHYAGVHLDLFQRLVVSTASLSIIRFAPDRPFLLLFNDTGAVPPAPKPAEDEKGAPEGEG
jgi:probable phosphoglycerate mutase